MLIDEVDYIIDTSEDFTICLHKIGVQLNDVYIIEKYFINDIICQEVVTKPE